MLILLCSLRSIAQKSYDHHPGTWVGYYLKYRLNSNWLSITDVQLRNLAEDQLIGVVAIRSGISYNINKQQSITGGFAWFQQQQKLTGKQRSVSDEIRLWQEIKQVFTTGRWYLSGQLRTEERFWLKKTNMAVRARLKTEAQFPLSEKWKLIAGNELIYQWATTRNGWDQNRSWLGAQYGFDSNNQLQVLFMNWWQISNHLHQPVFRINFLQSIN